MVVDKLFEAAQKTDGAVLQVPAFAGENIKEGTKHILSRTTEKRDVRKLEVPRVLQTKELDAFFAKAEMMSKQRNPEG